MKIECYEGYYNARNKFAKKGNDTFKSMPNVDSNTSNIFVSRLLPVGRCTVPNTAVTP